MRLYCTEHGELTVRLYLVDFAKYKLVEPGTKLIKHPASARV